MAKLTTAIEIGSGVSDYEAEIRVEYRHYAGCGPSRDHPGDDPETEILKLEVKHGDQWIEPDWLAELLADDEEILSLCALDWQEERVAVEEYRAEARAERMWEDRA